MNEEVTIVHIEFDATQFDPKGSFIKFLCASAVIKGTESSVLLMTQIKKQTAEPQRTQSF